MLLKLLEKILGLSWIGDLIKWLNGKKTVLSVITFVFSAIIIVLPVQFPELANIAEICQKAAAFLIRMGLDIDVLNVCGGIGVAWGLLHKGTKHELKKRKKG